MGRIMNNCDVPSERENLYVDCTIFPQRLRVGAFSNPQIYLPKSGTSNRSDLGQIPNTALIQADLSINLREIYLSHTLTDNIVKPGSVRFTMDGITSFPIHLAGTSWSTPIALSYLNYLKQTNPPGTSVEDLIRLATSDGKGRFKDPVWNGELEIYRLGILKPLNQKDEQICEL